MNQEKIGFDAWFELVGQSYTTPPVQYNGKVLPAFPSDTIQSNTTGQCGIPTLKEAFIFYKDCVNTFEKLNKPISGSSRILDFGIGWGRIARFFLRDVPLENIYGVDVTPEFTAICRETFRSENFFTCQPHPPTNLPDNHYDFITGYSVFSHLSEEACLAWMKEFSRILVPGGIVAVTTRGRPFFDFCESQMKKQEGLQATLRSLINKEPPSGYLEALGRLFQNFDEARLAYDRGEFVHSNVEGVGGGGALNTTFYGETFIPESYARRAYVPFLELENFMYEPSYQSHPIMFFRKKQ